jgi:hypothetical protein
MKLVHLNAIRMPHANSMIPKMQIAVNVMKASMVMANFVIKTINQLLFEAL